MEDTAELLAVHDGNNAPTLQDHQAIRKRVCIVTFSTAALLVLAACMWNRVEVRNLPGWGTTLGDDIKLLDEEVPDKPPSVPDKLPSIEEEWTIEGGVGIAEEHVKAASASTGSDWLIQFPDDWKRQKLQEWCKESEGSMKWCGDPENKGLSQVIWHGTKEQLAQCLKQHPGAVTGEQDRTVTAFPVVESTPLGMSRRLARQRVDNNLWGIDRIDSRNGRDGVYDNGNLEGAGVHVYVLDTGIRTTHQDFGGRAIPTLDVTQGRVNVCNPRDTSCAMDRNGHGSHCAGTIAGRTFGVAKRATVHAVKVLGDRGSGSMAGILRGIDFVAARGQRPAVISMSLGGRGRSRLQANAVNKATAAGITVVVAAGNDGQSRVPDACQYSPAHVPAAITVGSITEFRDSRSAFSNIGSCVDLFAPGSRILSVGIGSDRSTATLSGTSMACPHVAGAAARLLGEDRRRTPQAITNLLVSGATQGKVRDVRGSPNKLLFTGSGGGNGGGGGDFDGDTFLKISQGTCRDIGLSVITNKARCEAAARFINFPRLIPSARLSNTVPRPEGCYLYNHAELWMGVNSANRGRGALQSRHPICEGRFNFAEASRGNCASINGFPVTDTFTCQKAAEALGFPDTRLTSNGLTQASPRPEGCYFMNGNQLWFSINPDNKGRGAESSTPGSPRHPVCIVPR
mmetsp:Transcript_129566/g.361006  ORF Transcript_129566/g.361006 Transcript_129566/m.361006 type:complete len:683 (+) Transcript_129566:100-2148(+)|eukprot:CAMPEP_0179087576 /NCGR_PEP_ID=MMETSP0796-20121207/39800_1 /TAXON_ID=73915 /ORGANISM="Pyrodinium bahamense, Strain pbaha01" /LENGTH=682 /DNA_ID=CAMNT_0020785089 /DNA_START=95 /DNA_END=2143 /DNA_ORIENTATION=+